MALVECPECKKQISDRSKQCIGCGVQFSAQKCPECGSLLVLDSEECLNCGCMTLKGEIIEKEKQFERNLEELYKNSDGDNVKFIKGIRKLKKCGLEEAQSIAENYYIKIGEKYSKKPGLGDKASLWIFIPFFSFLALITLSGGFMPGFWFCIFLIAILIFNYKSQYKKIDNKKDSKPTYCPYCGSDHIEAYIEQTQHAAVTSTAYVANPFIPMMHKIEEKVSDEYTTSKVRYVCKSCNQIF